MLSDQLKKTRKISMKELFGLLYSGEKICANDLTSLKAEISTNAVNFRKNHVLLAMLASKKIYSTDLMQTVLEICPELLNTPNPITQILPIELVVIHAKRDAFEFLLSQEKLIIPEDLANKIDNPLCKQVAPRNKNAPKDNTKKGKHINEIKMLWEEFLKNKEEFRQKVAQQKAAREQKAALKREFASRQAVTLENEAPLDRLTQFLEDVAKSDEQTQEFFQIAFLSHQIFTQVTTLSEMATQMNDVPEKEEIRIRRAG